jgi:hypothetical protein
MVEVLQRPDQAHSGPEFGLEPWILGKLKQPGGRHHR